MSHVKRSMVRSILCLLLFAWFGMAAEEIWTEVKSPNFLVISNASPKQARRAARSFEQFRLLIKRGLPTFSVDPGAPLTVFAAKDEKSFKELLGEPRQEKGVSQKSGVFAAGPERNFVVFRIDLPGDQGYHVIYHEYVHMVTRLNLGELPLWLSEGLAEFFGYASVSDGKSTLGAPGPQSLQTLETQPMIPLSTLLEATRDSPHYRDIDKVPVFYAQSWALTHYLVIGDKRAHTKQLNEYLALIRKGVPEKEAAAQAFGDLGALEESLRRYVRSAAFYTLQYSGELGEADEDRYATRTLSPAESLASRGELLVYLNKADQARAALERSLQMDPRSGRANEAMGNLYSSLGDMGQAEEYFSTAADLDSNSYLAQFYSAQSKLQGGAEDVRRAEDQLRKAIGINPRFAAAYRQLSLALQKQAKLPEALEMAEKAVLLEPGVLNHSLNVAHILAAMGKIDEAREKARQVLALARTGPDRRQAESLLSSIESAQGQKQSGRSQAEIGGEEFPPTNEQRQQDAGKVEEQLRALDEMREKRRVETELRVRLKTGSPAKLAGLIKSVKCDYPATMDILLDSGGRQLQLHAENYYQVQYGAVGGAGRSDFDPCLELEGKEVEIDILSVSGADFSGLIQSVAIVK